MNLNCGWCVHVAQSLHQPGMIVMHKHSTSVSCGCEYPEIGCPRRWQWQAHRVLLQCRRCSRRWLGRQRSQPARCARHQQGRQVCSCWGVAGVRGLERVWSLLVQGVVGLLRGWEVAQQAQRPGHTPACCKGREQQCCKVQVMPQSGAAESTLDFPSIHWLLGPNPRPANYVSYVCMQHICSHNQSAQWSAGLATTTTVPLMCCKKLLYLSCLCKLRVHRKCAAPSPPGLR